VRLFIFQANNGVLQIFYIRVLNYIDKVWYWYCNR